MGELRERIRFEDVVIVEDDLKARLPPREDAFECVVALLRSLPVCVRIARRRSPGGSSYGEGPPGVPSTDPVVLHEEAPRG